MPRLPIEYRKKQLVCEVKMRSRSRQTITYRLHAQRALLMPSIMLRRTYLEKVHLAQIQSEKDAILSHIGRLQPRVRDEYLRSKKRVRIINDYLATRHAQGIGGNGELLTRVDLRIKEIHEDDYDNDRLHKRVEYLQNRDAALNDRIPQKAVGL